MKLNIEKSVLNFLVDFGLTEKEITVYMTLLKTGPNTIMNLARETGIKRSTTHNTVEELIKKGLVSQTNYGERRMVIAEDPEKLSFLMDQKKWDISKLEKNLPEMVKQINEHLPKGDLSSKPSIKYYDGKEATSSIYKQAFASNELRSYVNLSAVSSIFPENTDFYNSAQKKNKALKVREIVDGSEASIKLAEKFAKSPNFKFKASPGSINLKAIDILIYDGKVAFISFKESVVGTVIENAEYFYSSVEIFDFMWEIL